MNNLLLRYVKNNKVELRLGLVLLILCIILSITTEQFATFNNWSSLLNNNSINLIWAVGLLVVLIAGGIDISFAVASSVVQVIGVKLLISMGGGSWVLGFILCGMIGIGLGLINAYFIYTFRIISIVVTISTYSAFFGLLMFFTRGRSIYNLPSWLSKTYPIFRHEDATGNWAQLNLPVLVMTICVISTWFLIERTNLGRQLYAYGDNPEGARRAGTNIAAITAIAFGWLGLMAGIAGLMQANIVKEVVPNALYGRELEVLAAVVLGGARLGGGKGSVLGCILGVMFVAVAQNGLNLLGVSPFAFQMIIGAAILIAVSTSNINFRQLVQGKLGSAHDG